MARHRLWFGFAVAVAAVGGYFAPAQAQLADTLGAVAIGSSMDAQGGSVAMNVGNRAKQKINTISNQHNQQLEGAMGGGGRGGRGGRFGAEGATSDIGGATTDLINEANNPNGGGSGGAPSSAGAVSTKLNLPPLKYGPYTGGDLIDQLLQGGNGSYSLPSGRVVRHRVHLTRAQLRRRHRRGGHVRYSVSISYVPNRNWVLHYLPADRYKVLSADWPFVSTEFDKFYYRPWAPGILRQSANHVIGFHTWVDAMQAGYRPDPASKPEPGNEIAQVAHWTRGPHFEEFVEYVYAGQVNSHVVDTSYKYAAQIAQVTVDRPYTRPYLAETLDQVFAATLGEGEMPTSIGPPQFSPPSQQESSSAPGGRASGGPAAEGPASSGPAPGGEPGDTMDKREGDYNTFRNRAGALSSSRG